MAIIADYIDDRGNVYLQQYIKVHQVIARKDLMNVEVGINYSKDDAAPHTVVVIWSVPFALVSEQNLWQQAYVAIKAQWADGVDC